MITMIFFVNPVCFYNLLFSKFFKYDDFFIIITSYYITSNVPLPKRLFSCLPCSFDSCFSYGIDTNIVFLINQT